MKISMDIFPVSVEVPGKAKTITRGPRKGQQVPEKQFLGFIRQMYIELPHPLNVLGGVLRVNYKRKTETYKDKSEKTLNVFTVRKTPADTSIEGKDRIEKSEIFKKVGKPLVRFEKTCDFIDWLESVLGKKGDANAKAKALTYLLMNSVPERAQ